MQPSNDDRLIAITHLQKAKELINNAIYQMESEDVILDSEKNPEECALWDLRDKIYEVTELIASTRFKTLETSN
jgi:hypothetical protein